MPLRLPRTWLSRAFRVLRSISLFRLWTQSMTLCSSACTTDWTRTSSPLTSSLSQSSTLTTLRLTMSRRVSPFQRRRLTICTKWRDSLAVRLPTLRYSVSLRSILSIAVTRFSAVHSSSTARRRSQVSSRWSRRLLTRILTRFSLHTRITWHSQQVLRLSSSPQPTTLSQISTRSRRWSLLSHSRQRLTTSQQP